jgi:hypothetical protein
MANGDLVTQRRLGEIVGTARLQRWLRSGWIAPVERTANHVLFRVSDVRRTLRRAKRERCPPDKAEVLRVRAWEQRTGRGYKKVPARKPPDLDSIELDFSAL